MISWWWLLIAVMGFWLLLLAGAAVFDSEIRRQAGMVALTVAMLPLVPITVLLTRLDLGTARISPGDLAQFAQARSADKRSAWVFFAFKRGIIILRRWKSGDERDNRPVIKLNTIWAEERGRRRDDRDL